MTDTTLIRGDSARWYISITDANGAPVNLTGYTVWFTAKPAAAAAAGSDADDSTAVITHSIAINGAGAVTSSDGFAVGGIDYNQIPPAVVSGVASGVLTQTLSAADATLLAVGSYVYDLQVKDASGFVTTPINGLSHSVIADVTRRVVVP